jgi:hypothetical protein
MNQAQPNLMKTKIIVSLLIATGCVVANSLFAQNQRIDFPAASPLSTVKQRVGLTDIEVVYSRPSVKGRKIFGGLVPHGQVWRTGANQATKLTFSTPVKLNGAEIPAGTYGLFTIPDENEWTVIISKGSEQWGSYRYNSRDDLVRVKAKPVKLAEPVETFTIGFDDLRDESATLNLAWEKTRIPVKLEVDVASKLVPQIEAAMSAEGGNKPYFEAARFYYEHGLDINKARQWIDAAVAQREAFYIVHLKAKILAKQGDKEGAIAAAKRSTELAKAANDTSYVKMNEDLIASLR